MRSVIAHSLIVSCLMALVSVSPVTAQELKIGVVDMQEAMEKSEPGQEALSQLEEEFKKLKTKLEEEKSELDTMRQEIQKQSMMLSQEAKIDKESQYKSKVRDFQEMYKTYQQKMELKEKKLRQPILEKMVAIIKEFGQEKGYSMILEKQRSGVLFNDNAVEITKPVIERLNAQWQAGGDGQGDS